MKEILKNAIMHFPLVVEEECPAECIFQDILGAWEICSLECYVVVDGLTAEGGRPGAP